MKKKSIAAAAALFLVIAVCLIVHFTVNPVLVPGGNENAAARKIAESWLQKQISLRDFEVTEAHFFTFEDAQTTYVAMTYSVRPYTHALTCWYAGNGKNGEDGWLVNKYGFIAYRSFGPFAVTGFDCNTGL